MFQPLYQVMKLLIIVQLLTIAVFVLFSTQSHSLYTNNRNPTLDEQWSMYKTKFNKMHTNLEDIRRRAIWEENLKKIQKHNLEADLGKHTYHIGMNNFGDWSHEEYKANMIPAVQPYRNVSRKAVIQNSDVSKKLPVSFHWSGHVTSVKWQKKGCHTSPHHAAVAVFESAYSIKYGVLKDFSVQEMIDCVNIDGCRGARVTEVLRYIQNKGIQDQKSFSHKGGAAACIGSESTFKAYVKEVGFNTPTDEHAMRLALVNHGPITAYLDGRPFGFQFYLWGIYNSHFCSKMASINAVAIVGYGKDAWRIKNSYGIFWGQLGYAWVAIDVNACGIAGNTNYIIV